ncbi:hypothetical protein [Corynebacterium heidelbergense]|uniref:Uncharacterized protein n=1 Tax=Corynebacterium heidelbergense TaxID=2055947 RepID=A0A364VDX0_9CORY|nr:hypothetical protein [Corynebacterium heidelbergense]RAV34818.1 hypothetical protein CWC39_01420 [Corynebacterium heidelbergense]WCZ37205.1 ABC-2 family transporter protein [Corynebacterium heidelbergense]
MIRALRSEWTRTKALVGTWVFMLLIVGIVFLPNLGLRMAVSQDPGGGRVRVTDMNLGFIGTIVLILAFSAWRSRSPRAHKLHAQSFLVLPSRWPQLTAVMLVNLVMCMAAVTVGLLVSFALLASTGVGWQEGGAADLARLLFGYGAISLIASAVGVLIGSTAAAVALPIVWVAMEPALVNIHPFLANKVAPWLPMRNVLTLMTGESSGGHPILVLGAWALLFVAAAFWRHQRADVR